MKESLFFSPDEIMVGLVADDVDTVLKAGAIALGAAAGIPSQGIYERLRDSEQLGSTATGAGFALPHAFMTGLHEPMKLLMVLRNAVLFDPHNPLTAVDVVVMMIWPAFGQQGFLPSLARHSRIFGNIRLLEHLRSAANEADVIAALAGHKRGTPAMRSGVARDLIS
jgi:mannitol/fructose-specific phosphotransferase system IIA component (Ntr-type)